MWAVLKINKKNLESLKKDLCDKLGEDVKFYIPKLKLKKFFKKKTFTKESFLLDDYMLCFHKDFSKNSVLISLKYCRGLKYFLNDFWKSQEEIEKFVKKCKQNEDSSGYIKASFFDYKNYKNYEFISGPFTNMVFKLIYENKLSIKALMGKYSATISKENNLFRPL